MFRSCAGTACQPDLPCSTGDRLQCRNLPQHPSRSPLHVVLAHATCCTCSFTRGAGAAPVGSGPNRAAAGGPQQICTALCSSQTSSQVCLKSAETTHVQAQHVSLLRRKLSTACCTRMRGPSSEVRQDGGAAAHTSMLGHTSQCMLRRCQGAERASHLRLLRLLQAGCQRVHGGPEAAQVTLHLHCQGAPR